MQKLYFSDWIINIDVQKTAAYYNSISEEAGCKCSYCRNYIKACEYFPDDVLNFFSSLGIDPKKEGEFMEYEAASNMHLYQGFYHIVGSIITGQSRVIERWATLSLIKIGNFEFAFNDNLDLVSENFPKPVIQLEFEVTLPWLLNERE